MDIAKALPDRDRLEGSRNYLTWAFKVEQILRKEKCWIVFDPDTRALEASLLNEEEKDEKREKGIIVICGTVSNNIIPTEKKLQNQPTLLWRALRDRYSDGALTSQMVLRDELSQVKITEAMTLEEYVSAIDELVCKLSDTDYEVEEKELIRIAMRGLPTSWRNFVTTLGALLQQSPTMSFGTFIGYMQSEQLQRKMSNNSGEEALYVGHNNRGGNSRTQNSAQTRKSFSAPGAPTARNSSSTKSSTDKAKRSSCNFCGRNGHWESDCRFKSQFEQKMKDLMLSTFTELKGKRQINLAEGEETNDEAQSDSEEASEAEDNEINLVHDGDWIWTVVLVVTTPVAVVKSVHCSRYHIVSW